MIKKDLAFAIRNIRRHKTLAAINILGLSIGISACLIVFIIVGYEMSFDRFQPEKNRIFRVYSSFSGVMSGSSSGVPTAFPVVMRETFTGIESLTNFHTIPSQVEVPRDGMPAKKFGNYNKIAIADPEYFEVFNYYEWLAGSPKESLGEPFQVVITKSRGKAYFGDIDPLSMIGKEIRYMDSLAVTVSGIVEDVDERTDLDFTDFISFNTIEKSWLQKPIRLNSWQNTNSICQLFIKVSGGTSREQIEAQFPALTEGYKTHNQGAQWILTPKLQPLSDLHFNTGLRVFNHSRSVVEKSTLQMLLVVAGFLLTVAVINFVNLETAQASRRAKEVGIRKVMGSSRRRLIFRFISESFILCLVAAALSIVWAGLAFRYFTYYIPAGLSFDVLDPTVLIFLVSCVLVVTLFAGLYPAFVLSSHQPALALKNLASSTAATTRSAFIRKGLTIFQFSSAQVFIVATMVIVGQLEFMLDKDLGFSANAVVFVGTPYPANPDRLTSLKNELQTYTEVQAVTLHGNPPLTPGYATGIMNFDHGKETIEYNVHLKRADTSYLSVYGIHLLAGRNVLPVDSVHEYLINETFMKLLGFKHPRDVIGKTLDDATIVGVVNDFHGQPLHNEIKPTAISYRPGRNFGVKLATPNNKVSGLQGAMAKIERSYQKVFPDEAFEYYFVDERIRQFYEAEQRMASVAGFATAIAILISCLGLFGLASFTVLQRTKEIGIRKVLGASVNGILFLLSKDFLGLVLIAFIISAPVAYYAMDLWLQKFAYKIDITVWVFIVSGLASVTIALLTMSLRTVAAAKADPVKALRYE